MISLTDNYDPGDLDPGNTYPKADVVTLNHNRQAEQVNAQFCYGTESGGKLVPGKAAIVKLFVRNDATVDPVITDYDDLMNLLSNDAEKGGAAFNRCLCQHAVDKGLFAGTAS